MALSNSHFPSPYEEFIYTSHYARWVEEKKRREYFDETVSRYIDYISNHVKANHGYIIDNELRKDISDNILSLSVMPSMRALMTAGSALDRDNTCGYNCSYMPVDDIKAFDEAMFILLCGTGVGFSVERQYINQLPAIPDRLFQSDTVIAVKDSKEGWSKALRQLLALLYSGEIPKWDTSRVRPAGSRLKVFGGRASGPEPLEDLFRFIISIFKIAAGRKLNSLECHDVMCMIGRVVVSGGVRRSAMISLSNLSDDRMRVAKSGAWDTTNPQRALANNSVAYTEKPDVGTFMREWLALYDSKSGERGIFNREAAQKKDNGRRDLNHDFGCNPCSEIILRPYQFCNLTEVVIREDDNFDSIKNKVRVATILGTFQSTLTNFPYLRKIWQKNTEEERLLGVSLTGIMDNALFNNPREGLSDDLDALRDFAVNTNMDWASRLGINLSSAITCVKPSGTVSQMVNSASGIHARHSLYYIRRVRIDKKDSINALLKDCGFATEDDYYNPEHTNVYSFPIKAPANAVLREDRSAVEQLDLWKIYNDHWCEHKPSITVSVKENEWFEVGAWVFKHFDTVSGISFLPYDGHTYRQAPYEEITEEQYNTLVESTPKSIEWGDLAFYETEDNTIGSQNYACVGSNCEIVDLVR